MFFKKWTKLLRTLSSWSKVLVLFWRLLFFRSNLYSGYSIRISITYNNNNVKQNNLCLATLCLNLRRDKTIWFKWLKGSNFHGNIEVFQVNRFYSDCHSLWTTFFRWVFRSNKCIVSMFTNKRLDIAALLFPSNPINGTHRPQSVILFWVLLWNSVFMYNRTG